MLLVFTVSFLLFFTLILSFLILPFRLLSTLCKMCRINRIIRLDVYCQCVAIFNVYFCILFGYISG